jgi:CDP-4-dehydro-6-deoxyglucose reductase, E1
MNNKNKKLIEKIILKNNKLYSKYFYPLLDNAFSTEDLISGIKVLISGQLTMSKKTRNFEKEFAKKIGKKYALMVNSGSSANLLAAFASCNPLRKNRFKAGDEVLIPALCWSTSLWPLVQSGLKPVFVDVDKETLNVNSELLLKKINKKTKVIMLVHVLGNSTNVEKIKTIAKKRKIIIIEDTCESLGAKYKNKYLGTFGDFGTYSFYYSHQITSGEGGMIVCDNKEDYELLYSMRSHGWSRNLKSQKQIEKKNPKIDPKFIFVNSGFNLRPTDIVASIGNNQFKRLNKFIKIRDSNSLKIKKALKKSKKWNNQFSFQKINSNVKPSLFGFPIFINERFIKKKIEFLKFLDKKGVETRPIISGNFLNQPAIKLFKLNKKKQKFPEAQKVENSSFFIGLHTKNIDKKTLDRLVNTLLSIDTI